MVGLCAVDDETREACVDVLEPFLEPGLKELTLARRRAERLLLEGAQPARREQAREEELGQGFDRLDLQGGCREM